ncbi:cytochrome c biogenesis protein ResB [bacterium]|nr:cytochrome c biogenesis protein ResB [bacterium]
MKTLSSLQFGIVVLVTITIVAVIGTVIPQGQPPDFYSGHYGTMLYTVISMFRFDRTYSSPLFIGLLFLFGLNLVLCSLVKFPRLLAMTLRPDLTPDRGKLRAMPVFVALTDRSLDEIGGLFAEKGFPLKRVGENRFFGSRWSMGYLGASFVHVSLIVLLAGGLTSLMTGVRGSLVLEQGDEASSVILRNGQEMPLGFSVTLDRFDVLFYEDFPGRPKSFTSSVTVTPANRAAFTKVIRVNHPLMLNGFTVYQSSYGASERKEPETAADDTVRVVVSLQGAPESMPPVATFDMTADARYTVPGFGDSITVRLAELYRDFRRGGSSSGAANPAVKIDVLVHDETRWSVYAFKNFPGLNMPMNQKGLDFTFTMKDIFMAGNGPAGDGGNVRQPEYYTVLGVVRDSGVTVMWIGAILLVTGMFVSFYIRPKRIWVLEDRGEILIGARTKGDPGPLRSYIHTIVKPSATSKKGGAK